MLSQNCTASQALYRLVRVCKSDAPCAHDYQHVLMLLFATMLIDAPIAALSHASRARAHDCVGFSGQGSVAAMNPKRSTPSTRPTTHSDWECEIRPFPQLGQPRHSQGGPRQAAPHRHHGGRGRHAHGAAPPRHPGHALQRRRGRGEHSHRAPPPCIEGHAAAAPSSPAPPSSRLVSCSPRGRGRI